MPCGHLVCFEARVEKHQRGESGGGVVAFLRRRRDDGDVTDAGSEEKFASARRTRGEDQRRDQ